MRLKLIATGSIALGLVLGTAALAGATVKPQVSAKKMAATSGAVSSLPKAGGKAVLVLRSSKKGTQGTFAVAAGHLARNHKYDLIVAGVKVGTIATNRAGNGGAVFSTAGRRGRAALLGFDPRGSTVVVRDSATPDPTTSTDPLAGTDVLVTTIPDDNPAAGACCIANGETEDDGSSETECEDLDAAACTAAGGTPQTGITSCLPDPCNNPATPLPNGTAIACCINTTHDEGTETECEDRTEAECAAAGGTVIQVAVGTSGEADVCEPNPCQPTSLPPSTPAVPCCVPHTTHDGEVEPAECEDLTADACTAAGGSAPTNGATTCDPNPCQ